MDPLALLEELRACWDVTITGVDGCWRLSLESDRASRAHVYTGTDLARLIRNAHAGAPGGRY